MAKSKGGPIDSVTIESHHGGSGTVKKGQILRIVDVEGEQVADFVAIKAGDPTEYLDCVYTNWRLGRYKWSPGDTIYTNHMNPMWTIVEDKVQLHYTGGGFCSRDARRLYLNDDQPGCRDTIQTQYEENGLDPNLLQSVSCFNVFMHVAYEPDGRWEIRLPSSKPGDYIDLRAEMDLTWMVSVCAWPEVVNGTTLTPLRFETYDAG